MNEFNNVVSLQGVLSLVGNSHKVILQAVQQLYDTEQGDLWESNSNRSCTLIFIGNCYVISFIIKLIKLIFNQLQRNS